MDTALPQTPELTQKPDSTAIRPDAKRDSGVILIVDDAPMNAKLLADLLTFNGFETRSVFTGAEALDAIALDPPDLVLLDVVMPGLDGFETCRRIRSELKIAMLPVVMVTSLDSKTDRIRGLDAGADDFLSKPIDKYELLARVRSLMRIKRLYETVEAQRKELATLTAFQEKRIAEELAKGARLASLKRFFSPQLADLIVAGGTDDPLKSHRREISVVFLDLRGFTAFAADGEPEEVMKALGEFHEAMGELVYKYQGTLERFTGDGMMIFFNDPVPIAEPTLRASRMALDMRDAAAELNVRWSKRGFELGLGIGIADGYATVGAIGFEHRIDYAAIGPVTNLASRLCGIAAAGEILVSERAFRSLGGNAQGESRGESTIRGISKPVGIVALKSLPAA